MKPLRVVSLFAGIGGFDLGAEQAGLQSVAHVERDANCRKLLAAKFPAAAVLDDVCTAGAHNLPACDVLAGGWPCQDLSVAGKRAGLAGARSGLFYQLTRIAYELSPSFILWENVPGLLNSNNGRDMLRVVAEFQRIGYSGGWRTLDAQYFGLAQRRRRVFGVFARNDTGAGCCAEILSLHEGMRGHPAPRREAGKESPETLGRSVALSLNAGRDGYNDGSDQTYVCRDVAHTLACHQAKGGDPTLRAMNFKASHLNGGGQVAVAFALALRGRDGDAQMECGEPNLYNALRAGDGGSRRQNAVLTASSSVRHLTPRECERLQGFPDDWTAGFSDYVRYGMLGNAVAVPVARWLFARLASTTTPPAGPARARLS